jgi:hypothetical protein
MTGRVLSLFLFVLFVSMATFAEAGAVPAPAPEPVTSLLLAGGLAGLGIRAYRRRR